MELQTFAEHLKNISLSIDIVNDSTFSRIKTQTEQYFRKLDIKFFEFLTPIIVDGYPGLRSEWHTGGAHWSSRIQNEAGEYQGQISFSYDKVQQMCVVANDWKPLSEAQSYMNLWNNKRVEIEVPNYVNLSTVPIHASIMIPMNTENGSRIGIFNFEFGRGFEYSVRLQQELELLAEAFNTLYVLNRANKTQRRNTEQVISSLSRLDDYIVSFKKPKVFVASSSSADEDVMDSIEKVLREFRNEVKFVYWYDIDKSGNISDQILKEISDSTFGICYLSAKVKVDKKTTYPDNPNVVFEAGMIHGLSRIAVKGPKNWIPIRESEELAGRLPFDIVTERILEVPRNHGEFESKAFEVTLKSRFKTLVKPQ